VTKGAACASLLAALACAGACSSSTSGATPGDAGAGDAAPAADASPSNDGDLGDAGCSIPANVSGSSDCLQCLQASCCALVTTCADDPACVAFNNCMTECSSGVAPDGGGDFDASDDAGIHDCVAACERGTPPTALDRWRSQALCGSSSCGGVCR
jgi:hypothetical protein